MTATGKDQAEEVAAQACFQCNPADGGRHLQECAACSRTCRDKVRKSKVDACSTWEAGM